MTMICEDVRAALAEGDMCEETEGGARITTHCMYPSFEPVELVIAKVGDGYVVSDNGGAVNAAWLHGRDEISKVLARECARYGVECRSGVVEARVPSRDWLRSAILAVANASASAAATSLERAAASVLRRIFNSPNSGAPHSQA